MTAALASAGANYSIRWYNKGILFNTTTTPSVTYTKTMCTDSITAVVYGCNDSAVSNLKVVGCNVGVGSLQSAVGRLRVYPNPVDGELVITSTDKIKNIAISNLLGQIVFRQSYNEEEMAKVNTSDFVSGLYFVKIACPDASGGRVYVERVVKD